METLENAIKTYDMDAANRRSIDNVAVGPVSLLPGDTPKIDDRAWEALKMLGFIQSEYMLMYYEPSGYFGRLCAAFKSIPTREYIRITFGYSCPDPATRKPKDESVGVV